MSCSSGAGSALLWRALETHNSQLPPGGWGKAFAQLLQTRRFPISGGRALGDWTQQLVPVPSPSPDQQISAETGEISMPFLMGPSPALPPAPGAEVLLGKGLSLRRS